MNTEPTQQQVVRAVYGFAAQMMEKGLNAEAARTVVDNLSRARNDAVRKAAFKSMMYGGVAWGAAIFGGIRFFRGLTQLGG
jgi:hypothetical protein